MVSDGIPRLFLPRCVAPWAKRDIPRVCGVVSTGSAWKFLQLEGTALTIDVPEYYIDNLPKIMGILKQIVESV